MFGRIDPGWDDLDRIETRPVGQRLELLQPLVNLLSYKTVCVSRIEHSCMSPYPQTTSFTDYSYRLKYKGNSLSSSYFYEKVLVTFPIQLELKFPLLPWKPQPSHKVFPPGNLTLCSWAYARGSLWISNFVFWGTF